MNSPEWGSERGTRGEVSELGPDAFEEESRQAFAIDRRDTGWREPPDQPEPDHAVVGTQPVSLEASQKHSYQR